MNLSTSIVFEGTSCISAFGLISYNSHTGKFRMRNPLAFISGGINNLIEYLRERKNNALLNCVKWLGFSLIVTGVFLLST